jgi:hypothetical protein
MPRQRLEYRILLSSPSDLAEERKVAEEVTKEVSRTWGAYSGSVLQLLSWENDVAPQFGAEPQEVINKALGDDWDIYLGLMHGRFGSPTKKYGSGTEEEFGRAYDAWKKGGSSRKLTFYFKTAPLELDSIDTAQLEKVREFKKRVSNLGGVYKEFVHAEDFRDLFRAHLTTLLTELHKDHDSTLVQSQTVSNIKEVFSEEGSDGYLDYLESSMRGLADMVDAIAAIGSIMDVSTADVVAGNKIFSEASALGDVAGMRRGVSELSASVAKMAKNLSEARRNYSVSSRKAIDSLSQCIMMVNATGADVEGLRAQLDAPVSAAFSSIEEFVKTIRGL